MTTTDRITPSSRVSLAIEPDLLFGVTKVEYNDAPADPEEDWDYDGRLLRLSLHSLRTDEVYELADEDDTLFTLAAPSAKVYPTPYEIEKKAVADVEYFAAKSFAKFALVSREELGSFRSYAFRGENGNHAFRLVTWPFNLLVTGDIEEFWWQRTEDMLAWAKGSVNDVPYFAEKVVRTIPTVEYSSDNAKAVVWQEYFQRAERIIFDYEDFTRRGQRLSREEMLASLQEIRDNLLGHADDGEHAFVSHLYYDTNWFDGCDFPDLKVYKSSYLWAREAVKVAVRLLGAEIKRERERPIT